MKQQPDSMQSGKGLHLEIMCDDGMLHARWPDGDGKKVELVLEISDAENLISLAQDAIATWRKVQN